MRDSSGKFQTPRSGPEPEVRDVLLEFQRLTGFRVGSRGWELAIHEEDRAAVLTEWERAQRRGVFCLEYRLRFRDGHYYYVRGASCRKRGILRDRWFGYIVRVDRDHPHRCEGVRCYCPNSGPHVRR